jgi:hypothetical protein
VFRFGRSTPMRANSRKVEGPNIPHPMLRRPGLHANENENTRTLLRSHPRWPAKRPDSDDG